MQMLYNSDQFTVVLFGAVPDPAVEGGSGVAAPLGRGGYEIVDKFARKEIYLEGAMAEHFRAGVQALVDQEPSEEEFDEFIGRYSALAQQPLVLH